MIELTDEQRQELSAPEPVAIDPVTRDTYFLVRREAYERLKDLLALDDYDPDEGAALVNEVMAEDDAKDPYLESYQHYRTRDQPRQRMERRADEPGAQRAQRHRKQQVVAGFGRIDQPQEHERGGDPQQPEHASARPQQPPRSSASTGGELYSYRRPAFSVRRGLTRKLSLKKKL